MHTPKSASAAPSAKRLACAAALLLLLSACKTTPLYPPKLGDTERHRLNEAIRSLHPRNKTADTSSQDGNHRAVRIFSQPLQLPETDTGWEQQEYSIYIWASHPAYPGVGILRLHELGLLRIDLIGAPLKIRNPSAAPAQAAAGLRQHGLSSESAHEALRHNEVLELVVRAGDIHGPLRIAAWFPTEYRLDRDTPLQNPWADTALVNIRSGDLTTRIEIVDQIEARAAFGDEFPRHFYVGRVFLQNSNSKKKLIVYTTSMRAPVYLYRRTDNRSEPEKKAGKNNNTDSTHAIAPTATTTPAPTTGTTAGTMAATPAVQTIRAHLGQIRGYHKAADQHSPELRAWLAAELASLEKQYKAASDQIAATPAPSLAPDLPATAAQRITAAWTALHFLGADKGNPASPDDVGPALAALTQAATALDRTEADALLTQARALAELILRQADLDAQVRFLKGPDSADDTMPVRLLARALAAGVLKTDAAASPFADPTGIPVGLVDGTSAIIADQHKTANRALFSAPPAGPHNPGPLEIGRLGCIWRDTTRPLTFQAVLKSLILSQKDATRTKWVRGLELVGRTAGGLIALSPLVEEFGRQGWTRSVAFYSSVVTPEIGALLLEDLQSHIRNLGEMSLDTVVVLQPRSVVDRYVFFPRGPVFNHPDEFDQHSPAYIVKVLGDDLVVKTELVETNVSVNGEGSADALTQEALNKGTASASAELARQAAARAQIANTELSSTLGKIEKLLLRRKDPAADPLAIATTEAEVRRLIREYRLAYDKHGDAAFAGLLAEYGMRAEDAPPTVEPLPALTLVAGGVASPRVLPAKDDRTPAADLRVQAKVSGENVAWLAAPNAEGTALRYVADASRALTYRAGTPGTDPSRAPSIDKDEKRVIRLTVKDETGNTVEAEQTLTLKPFAPAYLPGVHKYDPATRTLTIPPSIKEFVPLGITLSIGDTAPEGWTVELTGTNGLGIRSARVALLPGGPGTLAGTLALDATVLKDTAGADTATATLTLRYRQDGRPVFTDTLTLNKQ